MARAPAAGCTAAPAARRCAGRRSRVPRDSWPRPAGARRPPGRGRDRGAAARCRPAGWTRCCGHAARSAVPGWRRAGRRRRAPRRAARRTRWRPGAGAAAAGSARPPTAGDRCAPSPSGRAPPSPGCPPRSPCPPAGPCLHSGPDRDRTGAGGAGVAGPGPGRPARCRPSRSRSPAGRRGRVPRTTRSVRRPAGPARGRASPRPNPDRTGAHRAPRPCRRPRGWAAPGAPRGRWRPGFRDGRSQGGSSVDQ